MITFTELKDCVAKQLDDETFSRMSNKEIITFFKENRANIELQRSKK
jgi:hypothetical protein